MANYKLCYGAFNDLQNHLNGLLDRIMRSVTQKFPLPQAVVQKHLADTDELDKLTSLAASGFVIPRYEHAMLSIAHPQFALARPVCVVVHSPQKSFWAKQAAPSFYGTVRNSTTKPFPTGAVPVDPELIPENQRAQLKLWAENVVMHARMVEVADALKSTIASHTQMFPTVGHIATRWPGLLELGKRTQWKEHFRNPPVRDRDAWDWPNDDRSVKLRRLIKIADQAITTGLMLPSEIQNSGYFARLVTWRRLDQDWHKDAAGI